MIRASARSCHVSTRARIASQLGLALAVILAVVISGSTVFALRSLDSANLATREEHLASEARLLADQLNTFHSTLRESTQRLSGLFEKRFGAGLSVRAASLSPWPAYRPQACSWGASC